jgi:hypothetical protein
MACDGNKSAFGRVFGNPSRDPGAHATEKDGSHAQANAVTGARVLISIKKQYGLIAGAHARGCEPERLNRPAPRACRCVRATP